MILFDGNFGGLSNSKWSGIAGSFARLVGIDGHSTPGILKIHQKLTKESGSTIDALCRVRVAVSVDGTSFWFSYTTGKIWSRTSAGTWTLVWTTTPAAGNAACLGAGEFDGYLYWATAQRLHRIPVATGMDTASYWTTNAVEDWATFDVGDDAFHPMQIQNLSLFIGDGNLVAKVDNESGSHTFTADALDLNAPLRVKCMIDFDIDLLLGTYIADTVNSAQIIRWDTEDTSYMSSDPIDENGINAFIRDDNYVYANCGQAGRNYLYDGQQLIPFSRIPGPWSSTFRGVVHPHASATFQTIPVFGLSRVAESSYDFITNGTFTGNANGWTLGSGWTYSSNAVGHSTGTAALEQTLSIQTNGVYIVTLNVGGTTGSVAVRLGDSGESQTVAAGAGATTLVMRAVGSTLKIYITPTTGFDGTVDTVTVTNQLPDSFGVYSFGSYSKDYQKVLDLSFPISAGLNEDTEIGAILVQGTTLLVSWRQGSSYGVDKLDYTAKYSGAYLETMIVTPSSVRSVFETIVSTFINYVNLPASTAVTVKYKKKHDTDWTTIDSSLVLDEPEAMQLIVKETVPKVAALQLRFEFTVSGNTAPEIEGLECTTNAETGV